jgi:negative regulator of flagellin synthesis FlgM
MSNKIDGYGQKPVVVSGGSRAPTTDRVERTSEAGSSRRPQDDSVTLTDSARQLQKLADAVANSPGMDPARVATLKDAVDRGEYRVDADRVAAKMLRLERELVGR